MIKEEIGTYKQSKDSRYMWTIFTKDEHCKRGEYSEEIDVMTNTRSVGAAKKVAQEALNADYVDGLRISRVEYRGESIPGVTQLF